MLRLSEIRRLKDSVDAEWRSAIADEVVVAWGIMPGAARWWRSSATHVFVIPGAPRRYLRFAPEESDAALRLRRGAELAATFPDVQGLMIARPLPNESGGRVSTSDTALGSMTAALVEEAPGEALDADSLSAEHAHRWGAALAQFHANAPATDASDSTPDTGDAELVEPLAGLHEALDALDPASHRRVTIHGDFELDNIRFTDDAVAVFDFDEARSGWAADDIALATRALRGDEGVRAHPELYAAFLEGYRSIAELSGEEEEAVAIHSLRYSALRAADESMLDEGSRPDDPEWQRELHDELRAANAWHERAVRDASAVPES
jgi:Ser/Thr protein kinase RdoA (MazF antagonist)